MAVVILRVRRMKMGRLGASLSVEMNRQDYLDGIRRWCVWTPHTMLIAAGKFYVLLGIGGLLSDFVCCGLLQRMGWAMVEV